MSALVFPRFLPLLAAWLVVLTSSGCKQTCDKVQQCDIRDTHCQKHIMSVVKCLRGGNAKLPPVTLLSEQDLAKRFNDEQAASPED